LNTLIETQSDVFGAPILSASTGTEVIIEDPTYNPVVRPTTTSVVEASNSEVEDSTVTVTDESSATLSEPAKASLIAVLVILVLIVFCCFGCGTLVICTYQISKASK